MTKRGRKPKPGPREPSGKAQRMRDKGTDELQERREWLAGKGDKSRTTYPLGILLANGAITEEHHSAGCRLAWLYAVVYGKTSIGAAGYERGRGTSTRQVDEKDELRWQKEVKRTLRALSGISRHVRDDVVSLVVYERVPNFLRPGFPTLGDFRHAERIKWGLARLAGERAKLDMAAE